MPKKLRLDLDLLEVQSFETDAAAEERGTVHARELSGPSCFNHCTFRGLTCEGQLTCGCSAPVATCLC
ncbi:MAG TPA: hypothetical protein VF746_13550 [Longimicrobium sp.]|jgi:hypothetical protein